MEAKKNRKWIYIALLALLVILLIVAVIKGKNSKKGIKVFTDKVELRDIKEDVSGSGKIYPETEVKISSDVSGEVVQLDVKEGDSVKVGQILAVVNPDTYQSVVERAKASLNNAKAQLANAKSMIQANIAQKEQIVSKLEIAKKNYERNKKLHDQKVISDVDFENAYSAYKELQSSLKSAEANILSARESAKAAGFNVKSAEAALKEANSNLKRTTIVAPIDGIVTMLAIEEGERVVGTIQMAGTEMMRISNLDNMEVRVEISENDILKVNYGDTATIEVDAYVDKKFTGKVVEVANSASDISSNTLNTDRVTNFIVKIRIDRDSYKDLLSEDMSKFPFRPGMSATVDIFTNMVKDAVSVPIQAVTTRPKHEKKGMKNEDKEDDVLKDDELLEVVFVVNADTVDMKEVVTGIQDDEYIQIKKGLDVGMEVVTGPYKTVSKKLKKGDKVTPKVDKEK
ncbi:MAG TPA: HlyD family efflux transporter periplasmic adaptor subunit [Bacteroidetes bacterium]|nr:HlyD family efflux transporter periplasmic adaptor subunit [Bacteroidota bacterium]